MQCHCIEADRLNSSSIFRNSCFTPGKAVQCSLVCGQCAGWCSAAPRLNSSCLKLIWLAPVNQRDGCGAISGCGGLTRHHYTSGLQFGIEVHWYSLLSPCWKCLQALDTFQDPSRPYFKLAFEHHLSTWNRNSCPRNLHWVVVRIVKTLETLSMYNCTSMSQLENSRH